MQVSPIEPNCFSFGNELNGGYNVRNCSDVTIPAGKVAAVSIGLRVQYPANYYLMADQNIDLDKMTRVVGISRSSGYANHSHIIENLVIYVHNLGSDAVKVPRGSHVAIIYAIEHKQIAIVDTNSRIAKYDVKEVPSTAPHFLAMLLETDGVEKYFPVISADLLAGKKGNIAEKLWNDAPNAIRKQITLDLEAYTQFKITGNK